MPRRDDWKWWLSLKAFSKEISMLANILSLSLILGNLAPLSIQSRF